MKKPTRAAVACEFYKVWKEYADEAEHQDGEEYWDNFKTVEDVLEDLVRYAKARKGPRVWKRVYCKYYHREEVAQELKRLERRLEIDHLEWEFEQESTWKEEED